MIRFALIAIFLTISLKTFSQKDRSSVHIDSSHSPKKATLMSIVVPGLGQIYNDIKRPENVKAKIWWKLPLFYSGLGASTYFVLKNQKTYSSFRNERLELQANPDPTVDHSINGYTDSQLKSIQDQYSKWRDLSIVAGLAFYIINVIDANVSGNLLHFDNGNDLSISIHPKMFYYNHSACTGLSLSFHFKDNRIRKPLTNSIFIK